MRHTTFRVALAIALCGCGSSSRKQESRFIVPTRFSVDVAAPAAQTGSLIAMTFDSLGRPVVSVERGHPTILIDSNSDGLFETMKIFTDKVKNCQGLWFDGRTLYATGNDSAGQAGLYKMEDTNGDDSADTFQRLNVFNREMGEHGPHDIRRGPDGHPTIMLGNHTGIPVELIDPLSPLRGLKEWQLLDPYFDARGHAVGIMAPGGVVARLDRDTGKYSILFGGFRNAYSHAYNMEGEAFTFDSDMEWDINMPWYRELRSVHGIPGADYGWRTGSGKFPAWYLDTLPPMREAGRGTPVGVEFYQHHVYPKEYFDAYLEGDWSRGRILITHPQREGGSYTVEPPPPVEFVHGEPLNVTDLEVGPDGFVYFTTGGRDTEGGLYRVRYTPGFIEKLARPNQPGGLVGIVRQPQPLSSWGHAALVKAKTSMGDAWAPEMEKLAGDSGYSGTDRIQALFNLHRLGPPPSDDLLITLSTDLDANMRAAALYVAGTRTSDQAKAIAANGLKDQEPFPRRRALEALVRQGLTTDKPGLAPVADVFKLLRDSDRFVRYAARLALERFPREQWKAMALKETELVATMDSMIALVRTAKSEADLAPVFDKLAGMFRKTALPAEDKLRLLRVFHVAAAEARQGAPPALRRQAYELLAPVFPTQDTRVNMEIARTLAYCGQPGAIDKILKAMPLGDDHQPLQIHYVYCLRTIKQGWTGPQKASLMKWFAKAAKWRGGASFTGFINLMFDSALEFFDAAEKKLAYQQVPEFAPLDQPIPRRPDRPGWTAPRVLARERGVEAVSAQEILEYQMFDPMTLRAKAEAGRKIYEKECASCHRLGDIGKDFGPDLTTINSRFQKKDLLESVLWPSRTISDQYQGWIVETTDGDVLNGLLVREANQKLVLRTAEVERPIEVPWVKVKSRRRSNVSLMPDNLLDGYSMGDISSLFAFLQQREIRK